MRIAGGSDSFCGTPSWLFWRGGGGKPCEGGRGNEGGGPFLSGPRSIAFADGTDGNSNDNGECTFLGASGGRLNVILTCACVGGSCASLIRRTSGGGAGGGVDEGGLGPLSLGGLGAFSLGGLGEGGSGGDGGGGSVMEIEGGGDLGDSEGAEREGGETRVEGTAGIEEAGGRGDEGR